MDKEALELARQQLATKLALVIYPVLIPVEQACVEIQTKNTKLVCDVARAAVDMFAGEYDPGVALLGPKIPKIEGFVIWNAKTKMFRQPGYWRKTPKIWTKLGSVKSHLSGQLMREYSTRTCWVPKTEYEDAYVIDISRNATVEGFSILEYLRQRARTMNMTVVER